MRKFFTTRNIVIILVVLAVTLLSAIFLRVPLPTIVLPAEKALKFGDFYITNTFIATIIADITILVLAYFERPVESSIALLTLFAGIPAFYLFRYFNRTDL